MGRLRGRGRGRGTGTCQAVKPYGFSVRPRNSTGIGYCLESVKSDFTKTSWCMCYQVATACYGSRVARSRRRDPREPATRHAGGRQRQAVLSQLARGCLHGPWSSSVAHSMLPATTCASSPAGGRPPFMRRSCREWTSECRDPLPRMPMQPASTAPSPQRTRGRCEQVALVVRLLDASVLEVLVGGAKPSQSV